MIRLDYTLSWFFDGWLDKIRGRYCVCQYEVEMCILEGREINALRDGERAFVASGNFPKSEAAVNNCSFQAGALDRNNA